MSINAPSATDNATKFIVEQKILGGSTRKGPYAIERALDPKDVIIKRRFGEGTKPLFERDEIAVNCDETKQISRSRTASTKHIFTRSTRSSSTESSSQERRRHRPERNRESVNLYNSNRSDRNEVIQLPTGIRRRTPDNAPYYLDEKREADRLRRLYGNTTAPRRHRRSEHSSPQSPVARRIRSRHRSRDKNDNSAHSSRHSTHRRLHSSSTSNDHKRRRHNSPYSRSRSRSRSPYEHSRRRTSRENRQSKTKRSYHEHQTSTETRQPTLAPTTQIITIPVPISEYPYGFPAAHNAWSIGPPAPNAHIVAPPRFPQYGAMPMMPPMRPPPYAMPLPPPPPYYNARFYRPPPRYSARPYRPIYRSRNT